MFKRVIIIVLDSVGIGGAPDALRFGNEGADTVGNIYKKRGYLRCPNLRRLGFEKIANIDKTNIKVEGAYGKMREISTGKDTTSGHWEIMGHPVQEPFPVFYHGFPKELVDLFEKKTGYGHLGNEVASGTEIIERLGAEHIKTGKPIIYTSADSVFQIAAHEEVIPLDELYRICKIVREEVCIGSYAVGRVIARPFVGKQGNYVRTGHRHDYSRMPEMVLNFEILKKANKQTIGVGKISDIYAHVGISASYPTVSNSHGMNKIAELMGGVFEEGLLMANLVEFDSEYGHRRDVEGYARAIEDFDYQLGGLIEILREDDVLFLTADHGNDPTWEGSDHTREEVPLLGYSPSLKKEIRLGTRETFADLGQTVLDNFACPLSKYGSSFLHLLK